MKRSNRLVLLIGIFLAIVAFVLIVLMLGNGGGGGGEPRRSQAPTTANVVVATKDIDLGTAIQQDQVGLKEIDITAKPADSYTDTVLVVGQIARQAVTAGQLITSDDHQRHGLDRAARRARRQGGHVGQGRPGQRRRHGHQGRRLRGRGRGLQHQAHRTRTRTTGLPKAVEHRCRHRRSRRSSRACRSWARCCPPPPAGARRPRAQRLARPPPARSTSLNGQEQIVILAVTLQQAEVLKYSQIKGLTPPNGITLVLRSSKDFVDAAGRAHHPAGHAHDRRHPPHPRRAVRRPAAAS